MPGEEFTREQRYALLRPLIERGIRQGVSASALYEQTKGTPLGIRKQDFLSLYREMAGIPKREETVKYTPKKYLFPAEGVRVEPWTLREPILYRFETVFEGVPEPRYFSLYSDKLMTIRQAEEIMSGILAEKSHEYWSELELEGRRMVSLRALSPIVSKELGPTWLKKQYRK